MLDTSLNLWQALLAVLSLIIPGIIAHSRLYGRVQLLEESVKVLEPLRQDMVEVKTTLARIETALSFIQQGNHGK